MPHARTSVVIAGGGPFGLMLANELGRRGVATLLVDPKPGTAYAPQANATQARTMEHYRRLGFADEVRALGMPPDFPTDIAYFTRFARYELARFALPSAREARQLVTTLSGSWSAAELPHRCNQKFIEPVLRRHAERLPGVSVNYGWRVTAFAETPEGGVEVQVERADGLQAQRVRAAYLVGGDGPRSLVRQRLGLRYAGETGVTRDFVGGRMYAVYARIADFYRAIPHPPAWMNVNFNRERRCFMPAVNGKDEFAFHTQLKPHEDERGITAANAAAMVQQAIGMPVAVEVLARDTWTAGHSLVAEGFGRRRVFIGGDAAHLFTPTGGLGYNTAVEDAGMNDDAGSAGPVSRFSPPASRVPGSTSGPPIQLASTGPERRWANSRSASAVSVGSVMACGVRMTSSPSLPGSRAATCRAWA